MDHQVTISAASLDLLARMAEHHPHYKDGTYYATHAILCARELVRNADKPKRIASGANAERENVLINRVTLHDLVAAAKTAPGSFTCRTQAMKRAQAALGYEVVVVPEPAPEPTPEIDRHDRDAILDHLTDLYQEWFKTTPYEDNPIPDARELLAGLQDRVNTNREEDWTLNHIDFLTHFSKAWEAIEGSRVR